MTLWYIWKWRCAKCFRSNEGLPEDIGGFLVQKFQEVLRVLEKASIMGIRWEAPDKGWLVLNTDGAAREGMGLAGAGGIIRDNMGNWVIGFSENLGKCSAIKAEIRAVFRGLTVAREQSVQKLWLQVDSKMVVSMLTNHTKGHPEYSNLLHHCQKLLNWSGWEVKVSHCFREPNQVADKLANMGI